MGIFTSEKFNSMEDLFKHELKDLYDAEHRIVEMLPQLADKAHNESLKQAFDQALATSPGSPSNGRGFPRPPACG